MVMEGRKRFPPQWEKLAAAVAYLTERSRRDDAFGLTKLVKLLYYADCAAYLRTGQPITGTPYVHMPHGPYPDDWENILRRLQDEHVISVLPEEIPNGNQRRRPVAGLPSAAAALTEPERRILDEQLRRFADFNAARIEEYSHDELAWRITKQGEAVPYELSGLRMPGPITHDVRERGNRIADRIRKDGRQTSRILVERQDAV